MINLITPVNKTSYGLVGANILKSLIETGLPVSLFPIGQIDAEERFHVYIRRALENAKLYDVESPCLRIFHQFSLAEFVGKGQHIGFPIFELTKFNEVEHHHLQNCDRLIVPSTWAKNVLLSCEIKSNEEISVIPLGVDPTIFHESNTKPWPQTIFLNIAKQELRKMHDVIVDVFNLAFTEDDNVELWMLWDNIFHNQQENEYWESLYKNSKLFNKIRFVKRLNTQNEVARLIQISDCLVATSRGEGWNLPALEAMSCGKSVIMCDYSGSTEFANKDNALLVDIDEMEDAYDGKWFFGQGQWASIGEKQINQMVQYMTYIHSEKTSGKSPVNSAGIKTAQAFTWAETARKLTEVLHG